MSTSVLKQPPYTYDIVGSFLRPARLKDARAEYAAGKINAAQLTAVEDECIAELVQKEKDAGLRAVTDGEFRRAMWHLDFLAALVGVEEISADTWSVEFKGPKPKGAQLRFTGKIDFGPDHPFLEHFRRLQKIAGGYPTKLTIPAPSMLHLIPCVRGKATYRPIDRYAGPDGDERLFEDIAVAYQHAIKAFYDEGCRYLQFDDTSWGEFCDADKRAAYEAEGIDLDAVAKRYVEIINRALETKPADMTITTHICRGNFRKFPELEDEDAVIARIHEAEKYVPLDRLRLSTQCGFSSTEEGNVLTEDDQWAKIALVRRIAERVWGE